MSRYVYLLSTLPASVIERAHESAFKEVPIERRREMFEALRPFMSEAERAEKAEPALLARVLRRASTQRGGTAVIDDVETDAASRRPDAARPVWPLDDPLLTSLVAYHFLSSATVATYFAAGAGSLGLAGEPAWVGDLAGVGPGGADGGFGGAFDGVGNVGFDGANFGGVGFDGGGFGGGFDGGGFGG